MDLDCDVVSTGIFDLAWPSTVERARKDGWASTPEEAVRAYADGPSFVRGEERVELREDTGTSRAGAVRFVATTPDGRVVGEITAHEGLRGVWAATEVSTCSSARLTSQAEAR